MSKGYPSLAPSLNQIGCLCKSLVNYECWGTSASLGTSLSCTVLVFDFAVRSDAWQSGAACIDVLAFGV